VTSTATSTLEQRVPIGAADLKANAQRLFRKALIVSAGIHLSIIALYVASTLYKPPDEVAYTGRVIRMTTLPPPPPLSAAPPPPVIPINQEIAKPTIGIVAPVPDAQAPEQTIMTQQELAQSFNPIVQGGSGKDSIYIAPTDDLPTEGEFVYYEDEPVAVTQVQPAYPEFAREAQIQGRVTLHVLVGKDGRVKNVKVIRGVTGLNEAAVSAIKQWVFKPALSNNKPVAVWVEIPMDFHF
jgi:periplasmic protein TonB